MNLAQRAYFHPGLLSEEVTELASDHSAAARAPRQPAMCRAAAPPGQPYAVQARLQQPEGERYHGCSGHGCTFRPKDTVHSGAPPAQVVVIHTGEVVVDQRVGMNDFE